MLELSKKTIEERGLQKPEEVSDSPSTSSGFGTFSKPEKVICPTYIFQISWKFQASSDNKQAESGVSSGVEDDEGGVEKTEFWQSIIPTRYEKPDNLIRG